MSISISIQGFGNISGTGQISLGKTLYSLESSSFVRGVESYYQGLARCSKKCASLEGDFLMQTMRELALHNPRDAARIASSIVPRDAESLAYFAGRMAAASTTNAAITTIMRGGDLGLLGVLASLSAFRGDLEHSIDQYRGPANSLTVEQAIEASLMGGLR